MNSEPWYTIDPAESAYLQTNMNLFRQWNAGQARFVSSALERVKDLEFRKLGSGQYACRAPGEEHPFYEPSNFLDRLNSEFRQITNSFQTQTELAVIAGSGLGYLASHLEEDIRRNFGRGLLLLENRAELIAAQFCLFDCCAVLQSRQVFWAVGDPLLTPLGEVFQKFRLDLIPHTHMKPVQERFLSSQDKTVYQKIGMWIGKTCQEGSRGVQRAKDCFQKKMERPALLEEGRIWAYTTPEAYIHAPLLRSFLRGFNECGWETGLMEIPDRFGTLHCVRNQLYECAPDVLLACNAADPYILCEFQHPRIIWLLDHPRYYAGDALKQHLSSLDHLFYADRSYGEELHPVQAKTSQFLPVVPSIEGQGKKREELAAPVVFVGSFSDASVFFHNIPSIIVDEINRQLDDLIQHPSRLGNEILTQNNVSEETLNILRCMANEYTRSIHRPLPETERQIDYFLYTLANSRKRERAVRSLLDEGIVVYGPESWLRVLGEKHAHQFRGWIANEDLADVYASADIVLNLHSLQCPTCLNCRDFDVVASGGCLLADWVEDYNQGLLEPGKDCIVVDQLDGLAGQVKALRENPEFRERIREQGHATYLERHTPKHRAEEIIRVLRENV